MRTSHEETNGKPIIAIAVDIRVSVINSILSRHGFARRIERLWGRGFQWIEAGADEHNAST